MPKQDDTDALLRRFGDLEEKLERHERIKQLEDGQGASRQHWIATSTEVRWCMVKLNAPGIGFIDLATAENVERRLIALRERRRGA